MHTTTDTTAVDRSHAVERRDLIVVAWQDPVVEALPGAIPTASDDFLLWWTPILGPTATLMAHRFAVYAADGVSTWPWIDLARTFGLGSSTSRADHTLARLVRFGIVERDERAARIRLWVPPLSLQQRVRLPGYLAAVYQS